MFETISKILTLIIYVPIYWIFIMIDRYIFDVNSSNRKWFKTNPFLKNRIPRSIPEILEYGTPEFPKGKWLFVTVMSKMNSNNNRKFLSYKILGGSEFEPEKSVIKIQLQFLEASSSIQEIPKSIDVFIKLSTCRRISCLFKAMISATAVPTVKEVNFNNTVYPFLCSIAQEQTSSKSSPSSSSFNEEFKRNFVVPKNILSDWSRTFDRSVIITECVDMSEFHSNPDWKNLTPDAVELMLGNLAYLHAMTLTFHDKNTGNVTRYPSPSVGKFIVANYHSEQKSAQWADAIISLYIANQPPSCKKVWAQIMKRLLREPTCVSHGDYRPGNMLFNENFTKQIITDWEASANTTMMWDVSYCILLGSSIENRRRDQRTYVENYLKKLERIYKILWCKEDHDDDDENFVIPGFPTLDQCMDVYKICLLMVDFWSWGIWQFGGIGKTQGNSENDGKTWHDKVLAGIVDSLTDTRDLARILDFDEGVDEGHKILLKFIDDLQTHKGLNFD